MERPLHSGWTRVKAPSRFAAGLLASVLALGLPAVFGQSAASRPSARFEWNLPAGFPEPRVPAENPMSAAKVELGRYLFYERRMSIGGMTSCATCHDQARAFTDVWPHAIGSTWEIHNRNSMSLTNVVYSAALTWASSVTTSLEAQAAVPIFGLKPVEMGLPREPAAFLRILKNEPIYRRLFPLSFPESADPYTMDNVTKAIACFERTLISGRSPYDRYHAGETRAMSESAVRGEALFRSDRLGCTQCHGGFNFSSATGFAGNGKAKVEFHNTGLHPHYGRDSGLQRENAQSGGRRKVQGADAAQYRADRSVHARRLDPDSRRCVEAL